MSPTCSSWLRVGRRPGRLGLREPDLLVLEHVGAAAGAGERIVERPPALTDPGPPARRVARDKRVRAATSRVTTAPAATKARSPIVVPQTMVGLAPMVSRRAAPTWARSRRAIPSPRRGTEIIGEDHVRPEEHLVFDRHPIPHEHRVLDRDAVADDGPTFDEGVVADVAVGADNGAGQNMRERPDARACPPMALLSQSPAGWTKTEGSRLTTWSSPRVAGPGLRPRSRRGGHRRRRRPPFPRAHPRRW